MSECFHCGNALPACADVRPLAVDGIPRNFCSESCRQVATVIVGDGLDEFYRFRTSPTPSPDRRDTSAERWSCYDRPLVQREFVIATPGGDCRANLLLGGVRCAACVWLIERAMQGVPGVSSIAVDPLTGRTELSWDPARVQLSSLLARVSALGYTPCPYVDDAAERAGVIERRKALKRLVVSGLGMMQVGSFAVALYLGAFQSMDPEIEFFLRMISLVVATPVVFYSGAPLFVGAWRNLRARTLGMDVPVAMAIGAAWAASVWNTFIGTGEVYFDSATMFVFLLGIARYMEMAGRHRAHSLTASLARHMPRVATRVQAGGGLQEIGVMELQVGDVVLVTPGTAIPADGEVVEGEASVDESLLTGESIPVVKHAGDPVFAGSLNLLQAIRVQVRLVGAETVLAHISQLVTAAGDEKPRLVRLADRVAVNFISRLLILSAGVAAWWLYAAPDRAFEIVLSVLVVTCPCALAIATPAVYTVAMSTLARRGFLVRRPAALEALARTTHVVFDKTGTLTEPGVSLDAVHPFKGLDARAVTAIATHLEAHSEHPLARAFPTPDRIADDVSVTAVPGRGLDGRIGGRAYRIGRLDFVLEPSAENATGHSPPDPGTRAVYLGDETGLLARFDIAERLRPGAVGAVSGLAAGGLTPMIASGDHAEAVGAMARRLGITAWHADLSPAGKLSLIKALQDDGRVVTMIGDGINDSPVLAGADVSIAMGSGTSLAQHAADCVLINPSLDTIGFAVETARTTVRRVRQNFAWAIFYNFSAIPLAAMGLIEPWMAAIGMSTSSLVVTLNALRMGRGQRTPVPQTDSVAASVPAMAAAR